MTGYFGYDAWRNVMETESSPQILQECLKEYYAANSCKGKNSCKSKNKCKGMNSCKGKKKRKRKSK